MTPTEIIVAILVLLPVTVSIVFWMFAVINLAKLNAYLKKADPDRWWEFHRLWGMRAYGTGLMIPYVFNSRDNEDEIIRWRKHRVRLGFCVWFCSLEERC